MEVALWKGWSSWVFSVDMVEGGEGWGSKENVDRGGKVCKRKE